MTDDKKINQIVNQIDSLEDVDNLTDEHFEIVRKYVSHKDAFVRSRCAYMLGEFTFAEFRTEESFKLLIHLCSDEDAFVRTEAYDSLSLRSDRRSETLLYKAIQNESDELADRYAILSWCDVVYCLHEKYDDDIKFLLKVIETGKCPLECWYGLYRFGNRQALNKMLDFLKSEDYFIRCSVLNLLSDIAKTEDKDIIMSAVEELLKTEKTIAVKSDAEKLKALLSDI